MKMNLFQRYRAMFTFCLIGLMGVALVSCKATVFPSGAGNSSLTGNITFTDSTNFVSNSGDTAQICAGLFTSPTFSQNALAQSITLSGSVAGNIAQSFQYTFTGLSTGTYYLSAMCNVNSSGTFYDHSDYAYPIAESPYTVFMSGPNTGIGNATSSSFLWPTSSGNQATPIQVSGTTSLNLTFDDTYITWGFNGQPVYSGTTVTLGSGSAELYAIAFLDSGLTQRTPANDWGDQPKSATNLTLATFEDEPAGTSLYVLLFADQTNADNSAFASPCGGTTPCIQHGDPYVIAGPLTVPSAFAKPSKGLLTNYTIADGQTWSRW